jgi:integrase/recombinase XerD
VFKPRGKEKELPVHHKLEELLDQYLKVTGLFPAALGKTGKLSRRPLVRTDAADMLKRRLKQAGLPAHYLPHSFRAIGCRFQLNRRPFALSSAKSYTV